MLSRRDTESAATPAVSKPSELSLSSVCKSCKRRSYWNDELKKARSALIGPDAEPPIDMLVYC